MRNIILSLAFGSITILVSAQSRTAQVAERIDELRTSGASFRTAQLFTGAPRSAATDALWDRTIASATVLQLNTSGCGTLLLESPDRIAFELPYANGTIILDLERVSILADDFTVVQASTGGTVGLPQGCSTPQKLDS